MSVVCPYCSQAAELVTGAEVYPHRPDLYAKPIWRCLPCDARVGCHPGTETPLGALATAEVRGARQMCHRVFDPLWKDAHLLPCYSDALRRNKNKRKQKNVRRHITSTARGRAYAWLAEQMNMTPQECHIGEITDMDVLRQLYKTCRAATAQTVRDWWKAKENEEAA